jgi:hypothetical protein
MNSHTWLYRLGLSAALAATLAACGPGGPGGPPDPGSTEPPPPASSVPTTEATPEPTTPPTLAPTLEPEPTEPPPTDAPDPTIVPIIWYGLVPPLTREELCGLLTHEEITAIQGWTWQPTTLDSFQGCAYSTVELHTGALVRFGNSALVEEEFRAYYPDALDLDGILLGDAYGRGRLDDIWIEMTGLDNLRLEIFATPLTEAQSLQLVEAVYPSP